MTPQTIPVDQPPSQEWQLYAQRESLQPQSNDANVTEEPSYIRVENEASARQTEDEELPRKLPRKTTLPTDTNTQETWDFTPPPETDTKTTILERPNSSRPSSKKIFLENKSTDQRTFQHIHTLRSHLSPVRALIPYNSSSTLPDETCYITASDDTLIKFWRVNRTGATPKKKGHFDILPQITYRGHTGIVTCLAESAGNIWSGGSDGGIRGWKTPNATRDAYGSSSTNFYFYGFINFR
jgi:WD40 repeat protein